MADELNIPTHRWYQPRNNIALPPNAVSAKYILANGVALIDAWINTNAWGPYSIDGFVPALACDFASEYYQANTAATSFSNAITHAASSNATMVDSDGLLKWRPHNLLTYSEQFDNASWTKSNVTVTADAAVAPDGTTTADKVVENTATSNHYVASSTLSVIAGQVFTTSVFAKAGERSIIQSSLSFVALGSNGYANFDLSAGTVTASGTGVTASITNVGNGWYLCETTAQYGSSGSAQQAWMLQTSGSATRGASYTGDGTSGLYLWGASAYRSDLGGMVNNPDRGDSYVPTTSSAVYLPRRGHHVYNGDTWVNKGLLHESEARVNLAPTSNTITGYTTAGVSLSSGAETSPSGLTDASQATSDGGATNHGFGTPQISYVTGTTYVNSFFLKAGTETWVQVTTASALSNNIWANFNLEDGTVGNAGPSVADTFIEPYGNGWYRCSISYVAPTSVSTLGAVVYMLNGTDAASRAPTFTNSGRTIFFYQEDINAAATPSSPIPTSGATVTRAAETLTVPAANLPWPSPVVIGEELVTNGTFDTDVSGWTAGTGLASWNPSGYLDVDRNGGVGVNVASSTVSGLVVGKVYRLTFDIIAQTNRLRMYFGSSNTITTSGQTGAIEILHVAASTSHTIQIDLLDNGTATATIDNISVKEINPLALSIQMDGLATYADRGIGDEVVLVDWQLNSNNRIRNRISTFGSDTGAFDTFQLVSGVVDTVQQDAPGSYSPGVNVPFNIASRHGSTFINGAVDGTALTADTTPVALPDLSATDLQLGYDYMGTISLFRIWADDIGNAGIAEASSLSLTPSLSLTFDGQSTSFTDTGMVV